MMQRDFYRNIFLWVIALLLLSSCSAPSATPAVGELVETMVAGTSAAVQASAPTLASPTPIPPTVEDTAAPTATEQPAPYWVFPPVGNSGNRAWQIDGEQISPLELPDLGFNHHDYSSAQGKILHSSRFPDVGAGPANLSVGDLWMYDVAAQQDQLILQDENVVEAVFVPGTLDIAYLLATPDTYELRWRSADGSQDRVLAVDVSPTFSVSPDGKSVAFTRETGYKVGTPGVYVVSTDGSGKRQIGVSDRGGSGSISDRPLWSPDGQHILLPISSLEVPSRWVLLKSDGSAELPLTFAPEVAPEFDQLGPVFFLWLPDGRQALASQVRDGMAGIPNAEETGVIKLDLDSGLATQFAPAAFGTLFPLQWEIPGKVAWAMNGAGELVRLDLENPHPLPQACKVAGMQMFVNPFKGYCFAYPQDVTIQAYEYERPLFLGEPLDQSSEPLQSRLWVEANDVPEGQNLGQALEDFLAGLPQSDPPTSTQPATLGGEPAVLLDNVPGQLFSRVVLGLHNGKLYQLWFNPVDGSVPHVQPDVEALYQAVLSSFAYLP